MPRIGQAKKATFHPYVNVPWFVAFTGGQELPLKIADFGICDFLLGF
jgi:hypothetical protein